MILPGKLIQRGAGEQGLEDICLMADLLRCLFICAKKAC